MSEAGEDGTIGKAYGYQLGVKYKKFKQGEMDQVDNIAAGMINTPEKESQAGTHV